MYSVQSDTSCSVLSFAWDLFLNKKLATQVQRQNCLEMSKLHCRLKDAHDLIIIGSHNPQSNWKTLAYSSLVILSQA